MPLILRLNVDARTDYAWVRESQEFRPIDAVISGQPKSWNVLGPGGTLLVFEDFDPRPLPREPWGGSPSTGPHVLDLISGTVRRLSVDRKEGISGRMEFAVAPDGRVAVAENVARASDAGPLMSSVSVSVTTPEVGEAREIFHHQAYLWVTGGDRALQWSPDGARIALSITDLSGDPLGRAPSRVLLLDTDTGRLIRVLDDVHLAGSTAWTPDSTRLLVVDVHGRFHLADTETGTTSALPLSPRDSARRSWDLVGTAGNDALLMYHQSGRNGRITTLSLTGGEQREVVSWRGEVDMYVTAAQMPDGYWD